MIEQEQAGIVYFEFESFGGNGRIQHAIFSRQGGVSQPPHDSLNLSVSVPDEKTAVYANRAKAFGLFGRQNDTVVHAHLIHGSDVARVTQANNGTWLEHFDALITNEPGCALTMNFADCTPILLYDPVQHAIGLGHAGWKGRCGRPAWRDGARHAAAVWQPAGRFTGRHWPVHQLGQLRSG
jgi:polyphenol oxidase